MNNEQKLSLAEAIAEIERCHQVNLDEQAVCPKESLERAYYNGSVDMGKDSLTILSRVDPDEEGQAVLWLMRELGWKIARNPKGWYRLEWTERGDIYHYFDPIKDAQDAKEKLRAAGL